jgi:hypothetical protein
MYKLSSFKAKSKYNTNVTNTDNNVTNTNTNTNVTNTDNNVTNTNTNTDLTNNNTGITNNNTGITNNNTDVINTNTSKSNKFLNLFNDIKTRNPSCGLIVVDNFYNNPYETRDFILTQEFTVKGNYPGKRTKSYATPQLKDTIQKYVQPFGGKITHFLIPEDNTDSAEIYNGSFQYTTSKDRSWVHIDGANNWAGVLYLTPNAPLSSGTAFYKFCDGAYCKRDMEILKNKANVDKYSQDITKWNMVDSVGNIFNRLILFNSERFHMSMDYFGDSKENGRLFQVFFFSTELNC